MPKLIALAVVLLLVTAAGAQSPPLAIARFYEQETLHSSLGNFRGATESWRGQIVLQRGRKVIGASYVSCIRVSAAVRNCYATYALPEGTMAALGIIGSRNAYSLTIVGGTGTYIDYRGWVSVTGLGSDGLRFSQLVFHLKH